ncbi:hypothetical protein ABE10_01245 [Bacillus toyonensis]|nr:hypothetical protein [Bacillus toyonensis]
MKDLPQHLPPILKSLRPLRILGVGRARFRRLAQEPGAERLSVKSDGIGIRVGHGTSVVMASCCAGARSSCTLQLATDIADLRNRSGGGTARDCGEAGHVVGVVGAEQVQVALVHGGDIGVAQILCSTRRGT